HYNDGHPISRYLAKAAEKTAMVSMKKQHRDNPRKRHNNCCEYQTDHRYEIFISGKLSNCNRKNNIPRAEKHRKHCQPDRQNFQKCKKMFHFSSRYLIEALVFEGKNFYFDVFKMI